jgi:hypothetical protein
MGGEEHHDDERVEKGALEGGQGRLRSDGFEESIEVPGDRPSLAVQPPLPALALLDIPSRPEEELPPLSAISALGPPIPAKFLASHANARPNADGTKVGGHQASSASAVSLMTALYFKRQLQPKRSEAHLCEPNDQ